MSFQALVPVYFRLPSQQFLCFGYIRLALFWVVSRQGLIYILDFDPVSASTSLAKSSSVISDGLAYVTGL